MKLDALKTALSANLQQYRGVAAAKKEGETVHVKPIDPLKPATWTDFTKAMVSWAEDVSGIALTSTPEVEKPTFLESAKKLFNKTYEYLVDDGKSAQLLRFITKLDEKINRAPSQEVVVILLINALAELKELRQSNSFFRESGQCKELEDCLFKGLMVVGSYTKDKQDPYLHDLLQPLRFYFGINKNKKHTADEKSVGGHHVSTFNGVFVQSFFENLKTSQTNFLNQTATHYYSFTDTKLAHALLYATHEDKFIHAAKALILSDPKAEAFVKVAWQAAKKKADLNKETQLSDNLIAQMEQLLNPVALDNTVSASVTPFMADVDVETTVSARVPFQDEFISEALPIRENPAELPVSLPHRIDSIQLEQGKWSAKLGLEHDPLKQQMLEGVNSCIATFNDGLTKPPFVIKIAKDGASLKEKNLDRTAELSVINESVKDLGLIVDLDKLSKARVRLYDMFDDDFLKKTLDAYLLQHVDKMGDLSKDSLTAYTVKQRYLFLKELDENYQLPESLSASVKEFLTDGKSHVLDVDEKFIASIKSESHLRRDLAELQALVIARKSTLALESFVVEDLATLAAKFTTAQQQFEQFKGDLKAEPVGMAFYREALASTLLSKLQQGFQRTQEGDFTHAKAFALATRIQQSSQGFLPEKDGAAIQLVDSIDSIVAQNSHTRAKNTTFIVSEPAGYYQTDEHGQLKAIASELAMSDHVLHSAFFNKDLPLGVDIKVKLSSEEVKKLDDFFHYRNGHFHQAQSFQSVLGNVQAIDKNALNFLSTLDREEGDIQAKALPKTVISQCSEFILQYGNFEQQQMLAAMLPGFAAKEGLILPAEVMVSITQQKARLPQWRSTLEKNKPLLQELSVALISGEYFKQALRDNGLKDAPLRDKILAFPALLDALKQQFPPALKTNRAFQVAISQQLQTLVSDITKQCKVELKANSQFLQSAEAKAYTRFIIQHASLSERIQHYRFLQETIKPEVDVIVNSGSPQMADEIQALAQRLCLDDVDWSDPKTKQVRGSAQLQGERQVLANYVVDRIVSAEASGVNKVNRSPALSEYIRAHADARHQTQLQRGATAQEVFATTKVAFRQTIENLSADISHYKKNGGKRSSEIGILEKAITAICVKLDNEKGLTDEDVRAFIGLVETQKKAIKDSYALTSLVGWGASHSQLFVALDKFQSQTLFKQFGQLEESFRAAKTVEVMNTLLAKPNSEEALGLVAIDKDLLLEGVKRALTALALDGKGTMESVAEQAMKLTRLATNLHDQYPEHGPQILAQILADSPLIKPLFERLKTLKSDESPQFISALLTKLQPDEKELFSSFNAGEIIDFSPYLSEAMQQSLDKQLLSLAMGAVMPENVEPQSRLITLFGSDEQKASYANLYWMHSEIARKADLEQSLLAYPLAESLQNETAFRDLSFLQLPPELPDELPVSSQSLPENDFEDYYSPQAVFAREKEAVMSARSQFFSELRDLTSQPLLERYAFTLFEFLKRDWSTVDSALREKCMQLQEVCLVPPADYATQLTDFMKALTAAKPALANASEFATARLLLETLKGVDATLPSDASGNDQRTGFISTALTQALMAEGDLSLEQRSMLFQEACVLLEAMSRAKHPAIDATFILQVAAIFNAAEAVLPSLKKDGKTDSPLLVVTTAVLNQLKEVLPKDNSQAATECRLAVNAAIKHMVSEAKSNAGPSMRASVVEEVQSSARTSMFSSRTTTVTPSAKITLVDMSDSLTALATKISAIEPVKALLFKDIGDAKPGSSAFKEASKNQQYIINDYAVFHCASAASTPTPIGKLADVNPIRHQLAFIESTVPPKDVQSRSAAAIQFHVDHGALNTQVAMVLREVIDLSNDFETLQTSEQNFFVESVKALNGKLETLGLPSLKLEQPAAMSERANAVSKYLVLETTLKQALADLQAYSSLNGVDADNTKKRKVAQDLTGQVETFLTAAKAALTSGVAPVDDLSASIATLQNTLMNALKKPSTQFMRSLDKANTDIHQALLAYEVRPQASMESKKIAALQEGLSMAIGKLQRYPRLADTSVDNQAKRQFFNAFRAELQTVSLLLLTSPAEGEKRLAGLSDKIATLEKGLTGSGTQFKERLDIAKGMMVDAVKTYQNYVAEREKEHSVRTELVSEISEILTLFASKPLEGEQRLFALTDKIAVWDKDCSTDTMKKLLEPCQAIIQAARLAHQTAQAVKIETPTIVNVVNELDVLVRHARTDSSESVMIHADCVVDSPKVNALFIPDVQVLTGDEAIKTGRESIALPVRPESIDLSVESRGGMPVTATPFHEIERLKAPVKSLIIFLSTLSNGLGNSHSGPGPGKSLSEDAVHAINTDMDSRDNGIRNNRVMAFLNLAPLLQKVTGVCMVYFSCAALPYISSVLRLLHLIHA